MKDMGEIIHRTYPTTPIVWASNNVYHTSNGVYHI